MATTDGTRAASEATRQDDVVVIGGGMAGLAAAEAVRRTGRLVALLETGPQVGGLARSIRVEVRPLSSQYRVNVTDRTGMGRVGIYEHTDFVPAEGDVLVRRMAADVDVSLQGG